MVTKKEVNDFIAKMAPIAQAQAKKHNNQIYASVCIGQACQETGYGTSKKMNDAKAVFGIKVGKSAWHFGTAWKDEAYKTGTTEYYDGKNATKIVDWFRAYDSIEDATEDYFDMLCHCQRYKPALNCATPEECIRAIVKGGYATGPEYAEHVINIINTYNLKQYDEGDEGAPAHIQKRRVLKYTKPIMTGSDVVLVQQILIKQGYNVGSSGADGKYGTLTERAVKQFQNEHGLVVDGKVGPKTWTMLEKYN